MSERVTSPARRVAAVMALLLSRGLCQADELTDKVVEAFRNQAPVLRVSVKTDDDLQVVGRSGPLTVHLFNVRTACASNQELCNDKVSSFVQGIVSVATADPSGAAFVADKVNVVLRNAGFAKRANDAFKEPGKRLVVLPFIEGIELLFVVDGEKSLRYINRGDMAAAGLTEPALLDLASRNAALLPQPQVEPVKAMPGLYFMPTTDGLGTSRAFDAALWKKLEATAGGPVAMAVPTRDWVLFTRADQPELVAKLRTVVGRIVKGEPYPVSDAVMTRDGTGWKVLPGP